MGDVRVKCIKNWEIAHGVERNDGDESGMLVLVADEVEERKVVDVGLVLGVGAVVVGGDLESTDFDVDEDE